MFHKKLRRGFHWQSIETGGTGRGIPDDNFCAAGVEGWLEYKWTEAWAVGLSPEQVGWHKKRILMGGRSLVAVRRQHEGGERKGEPQDQLWLCSGRYAGHLRRDGLRAEGVVWMGFWEGGPTAWNWDSIRMHILTSPV